MTPPPPNYAQYPRSFLPTVRFDVIGEAFQLFSRDAKGWMIASVPYLIATSAYSLVYFAVTVAEAFTTGGASRTSSQSLAMSALQIVVAIVYGFAYSLFVAGITRMALIVIRGGSVTPSDALKFDGKIGQILLLGLLNGLLYVFGLCVCCLPGFIFSGLAMLSYPIIMDQRVNAIEAIAKSFDILKPQMWPATGLNFVLLLLCGMLSGTCVGAVIGLPILGIGYALVYRDMVLIPNSTVNPAFR